MNVKGRQALLRCLDKVIKGLQTEGADSLNLANRPVRSKDGGYISIGSRLTRVFENCSEFAHEMRVYSTPDDQYWVHTMNLADGVTFQIAFNRWEVWLEDQWVEIVNLDTIRLSDQVFDTKARYTTRTDLLNLQDVRKLVKAMK